MKPLAIDLFCGLGGWTEGLLAEGYEVVGFDIERHQYGDAKYPAQLVLQDVLTLHGSQFRDAALIVASPPCQAYSYRAMPFRNARSLPPPDNALFRACFRIQREACEATWQDCPRCGEDCIRECPSCKGTGLIGRYIPLVVENVRGAERWVGPAKWHYGSFYLWGDVPAIMPHALRVAKNGGDWFSSGAGMSLQRRASSRSKARKAAAATIAKIPFDLSRHIARTYYPHAWEDTAKRLADSAGYGYNGDESECAGACNTHTLLSSSSLNRRLDA